MSRCIFESLFCTGVLAPEESKDPADDARAPQIRPAEQIEPRALFDFVVQRLLDGFCLDATQTQFAVFSRPHAFEAVDCAVHAALG